MSEHNEAEMRNDISEYLQLAAKIKHLEAEQALLKEHLEKGMSAAGVLEVAGTDGKATMQAKNEYKFDVGGILRVVPGVVAKLKITNEVFNQILVGNEAAIGPMRTVSKTTYPIVVKANK